MPHDLFIQAAQVHLQRRLPAKQIIRGYGEKLRQTDKHLDGRLNIVILPIGHGLFRYPKALGQGHLAVSLGHTKVRRSCGGIPR